MRAYLWGLSALLALGSAPALAVDHPVKIKNESRDTLTRIVVHHGTVTGFKPLAAQKSENVTVSLPDGTCKVDISLTFSSGDDLSMKFDFCRWDTLSLW